MNRERACIDFEPTKKWVMLTDGGSVIDLLALWRGQRGEESSPVSTSQQLLLRAEKCICLSRRFSAWV